MQIILVGFGFYVFGDENLNGGTVMPAILKWGSLRSQEDINITCLSQDTFNTIKPIYYIDSDSQTLKLY